MRGKVLVLVLLVFSSYLVFAMNSSDDFNFDFENVTSEFGAIRGTIEDETENIFSREINFPDWIRPLTNQLFGKNITIEKFVILFGIWLILFFVIRGTIEFVPFFEGGFIKFAGSAVVTLLILLTGVLDNLAYQYYSWLDGLSFLNNNAHFFKILVGAFLLVFVGITVSKLGYKIANKIMLEKAEVAGENLNMAASIGKIQSESMD